MILGSHATAIGLGAEASGSNATAIGFGAEASGNVSVAMGNTTKAIGNNSTAFGEGTLANVRGGLTMGRYNEEVIIDPNAVTSNDRIFQIGNGTTNNNRNDIFYIRRNGKVIANDIELMSDIRLKKNIVPLNEALSKIAHIQPIIYNFINTQNIPR